MLKQMRLSWFLSLSILAISLLPVAVCAALCLNSFENGLDAVVELGMARAARECLASGTDGGAGAIPGMQVFQRWEDLPAPARERLARPPQAGLFCLLEEDAGWLRMPRNVSYLLRHAAGGREIYVLQELPYSAFAAAMQGTVAAVLLASLAALLALLAFTRLLVRRITRPVSDLSRWASSLDARRLSAPAPDFSYPELNSLAGRIRDGLLAEREALERE
nr:sensor histidine kinase [Desulfovibrio sp.]